MCSEIPLRDYRATDIEAMFRLDEACFAPEFRFSRRSMRSFAEEQGAITLVAEDPTGGIAGFVIIYLEAALSEQRGYVVTLDVAKAYRREGLATRLLREAEFRTFTVGARWMELHVFTGNDGAIRFYERMGFKRGELQRGFYGQAGIDAFVYRKDLSDL